MGNSRVKINRISGIHDKLSVAQSNNNRAFQYKVKFLTLMRDQFRHFICGLQGYQERLHDFICITESKILKMILRITVDNLTAASADHVERIQLCTLSGANLRKVHLEFCCDRINHTDRHIFAVLLVGCIDLRTQTQFLCQFFYCIVADFAQLSQPCADLVIFIHCVVSFHSLLQYLRLRCL